MLSWKEAILIAGLQGYTGLYTSCPQNSSVPGASLCKGDNYDDEWNRLDKKQRVALLIKWFHSVFFHSHHPTPRQIIIIFKKKTLRGSLGWLCDKLCFPKTKRAVDTMQAPSADARSADAALKIYKYSTLLVASILQWKSNAIPWTQCYSSALIWLLFGSVYLLSFSFICETKHLAKWILVYTCMLQTKSTS